MTNDERLGPPPVEPLSDAAWSRVERGVWSQLDTTIASARRPRRWWLVAGPLVAALAMVAIALGLRAGSGPLAVSDEPSRVVSGTSPSAVSFGDAHVALAADTALVLDREAGHPVVLIERGAAWFTVAARQGRPDFIVRAGDATIHVVGTRFRVARSEEHVTVDVEHGLVNVWFRGAVAAVSQHQHWSSESPGLAATVASLPATEAASPVQVPVADAASPVAEAAPRTPVTPVRPMEPASEPPGKPAHRPTSTGNAAPRPRRDARPPAPLTPPASSTARTEYDRLAALEVSQGEAALNGYLALARKPGPWADAALFAAARLATDRHDRRAATLLEMYLQRFPAGANATDARQLLTRLQGDHR